ncbi:hypothetical protein F511_02165 [Dorcoceras hygrometricum]|uniref:Uncharacterized protein n=1 Tax=Dorcoceras hygrometricum TaxID=472368 RepID=A0A2Z7BH00_9LAMI|nr:hypothetical protein F511_02165 [Dorcoceras hygrometricum]
MLAVVALGEVAAGSRRAIVRMIDEATRVGQHFWVLTAICHVVTSRGSIVVLVSNQSLMRGDIVLLS